MPEGVTGEPLPFKSYHEWVSCQILAGHVVAYQVNF